MNKICIKYYRSPYGELILGSFEDQLCMCDWRYRKMRHIINRRIQNGLSAFFEESTTEILENATLQLEEYFEERRKEFNIKLLMVGTPFQHRVWNELVKIPFGQTETYMGLSRRIDNEEAIRAVAAANGANAISVFIPCHRILGSRGEMTGYAGGKEVKKKLLELEGYNEYPEQLNLFK